MALRGGPLGFGNGGYCVALLARGGGGGGGGGGGRTPVHWLLFRLGTWL